MNPYLRLRLFFTLIGLVLPAVSAVSAGETPWQRVRDMGDEAFKHGDAVSALAVSPDGKLCASGSWDKAVRLWDLEQHKGLRELKGTPGLIRAVAFSPDGVRLFAGADALEHGVDVWKVAGGEKIATLKEEAANAFAFIAAGAKGKGQDAKENVKEQVILARHTGELAVWVVGEEKPAKWNDAAEVMRLATHPNGSHLAGADLNGKLAIWSTKTGKTIIECVGQEDQISDAGFAQGGAGLLAGSRDGKVRLYAPDFVSDEPECKPRATVDLKQPVRALAVHPDGIHWAALAGHGGQSQVVFGTVAPRDAQADAGGDEQAQAIQIVQREGLGRDFRDPVCLVFAPKAARLIVGNRDGTLTIYEKTAKAGKAKGEEKDEAPKKETP